MIRPLLVCFFASIGAVLVSCKPKHEGDVPLTVTNAPACKAGHAMTKQVVLRIENGSDFVQFPLSEKMFAVNTWAGRKATVKAAICEPGPCQNPLFFRTIETTVGGGDEGLKLEMPKLEVPCDDGTMATN